jgi:hypothetical protein
LSVTRRSVRCRSGSEISGAGLYERQGAERWSRSVEGCGIRDELNDSIEASPYQSLSSWHFAMTRIREKWLKKVKRGGRLGAMVE